MRFDQYTWIPQLNLPAGLSEGRAWRSEDTQHRRVKVFFGAGQSVVIGLRNPLTAPVISTLLEAEIHCLRYEGLAPRDLHQYSTAESGINSSIFITVARQIFLRKRRQPWSER